MNRKGFTLIELIAVIVMIGLIMVIVVPNILDIVSESKETSYNTLVKNIVTSSEMYYEECEYGDLSSNTKYGRYACSIDTRTSTITIPLSSLANTGFLKVNDTKEEAGKEVKVVLNPKNNIDMSDCKIKITKVKQTNEEENGIENIKVTYKVEPDPISGSDCPTTADYGAVK